MTNIIDFQLADRKEGESIILMQRRAPIVLILPIIKTILFGVFPFLVVIKFLSNTLFVPIFLFCWIIIGATYLFFEVYNWYRDLYVLTNERIIDIDQKSFFHRVVSETTLDKVQDVTYEVKGVFATLFDFGTVFVQTGGAKGTIAWEDVMKPGSVQKKIMASLDDYQKRHKADVSAKELIDIIIDEKKSAEPADD